MSLLKNLLFTILVPGSVAGWIPFWILSGPSGMPPVTAWSLLFGVPAFAIGVSVYSWCLWDFAVTGRGTPAPIDPPKVLVVRGLYRYVRNPMYLGVLSVVAGWALTFRSFAVAGYLGLVALLFHLAVLLVEEPLLREKFGDAYTNYCRLVSRWWPHRAEVLS